jgi:aspartyl-tRNA(Asn)/glutamyl-tRNA(Gln) amidotransferase subunit C
MQVTDALIDKLCSLAKLDPTAGGEAGRVALRGALERMLGFVEAINRLDTDGVEPLIHMNDAVNQFRTDEPQASITHQQALANAPRHDSDYIRVPKVLDKSGASGG